MKDLIGREGFSVYLRSLSLLDVHHMMKWVNEPEHTKNMARLHHKVTLEEETQWVQKMITSPNDFVYVIIRESDGAYIGNVGIHEIYGNARRGRIGLFIQESGQGYGKQALQLICDAAFQHLKLHKLWLIHYAHNTRMKHMTDLLGFRQEGVMRDEYVDHEGNFHDMIRTCILEQDYPQQ